MPIRAAIPNPRDAARYLALVNAPGGPWLRGSLPPPKPKPELEPFPLTAEEINDLIAGL